MGRKEGDRAPFTGELGQRLTQFLWPGPRSTSVPSGIFIHPAVWLQSRGPKIGRWLCSFLWAENWGLFTFRGEELGPHLTQCRLSRGLPPYQVAF